jgi:dipeptidyl-peptidase 4
MKAKVLLFLFFSGINFCHAQNALTLQEAVLQARATLAPENIRGLQFIPQTDDYIYLKQVNKQDVWMKAVLKTNKETAFLNIANLNQALAKAGADTLTKAPQLKLIDANNFLIKQTKMDVLVNLLANDTYAITSFKNYEGYQLLDADAMQTCRVWLYNYNILVQQGNAIKTITNNGEKHIVYGQSVHRDEFGINKGIFISPKNNAIAFYKMDERKVADYPIINWTTNPATNENVKYPMAGGTSHQVTVGVYNVKNEKTIWLKTKPNSDHYLTNICWTPNEQFILVAEVNREQNEMNLNLYQALTGSFIRTILTEKNDKYIEPLKPALFLPNNPSQFIWQSRNQGFNALFIYNLNGELLHTINQPNAEITDVKGFNAKGDALFYTAATNNGLDRQLFMYNFKTNKYKQLTTASGTHSNQLSSSGNYYIDAFSSLTTPRNISIAQTNANKQWLLLTAANPISNKTIVAPTLDSFTSPQGHTINERWYKPQNFDANKTYPTIVYWYGGPHAQMITNSWNGGATELWFNYLAQQGFLVYTIDTYGSSNRGLAFEQAIFGEAGKAQMENLETALIKISKFSFVDSKRLGLFGWSYGGFMTTNFVLNHPGVFKASVAGGPVMDWSLYEIMYTERYMNTPKENAEGYAKTNLILQAKKLRDKLLLIHGQQDPVVVQQHSVNFVRECVNQGVQVDYMIYPGHEHNVLGKDRVHLYTKIYEYFKANL